MASLIGENRQSDSLQIDEYTITADEGMRRNVLKEATTLGIEKEGNIIIGNWQSEGPEEEELCHGEMFDTILAKDDDYCLFMKAVITFQKHI